MRVTAGSKTRTLSCWVIWPGCSCTQRNLAQIVIMSAGIAEKVFRVIGSRSRSCSDGHRNLVNLIAPEPVKGIKQKLLQGRETNCLGFQRSKVRVTETFAAEA